MHRCLQIQEILSIIFQYANLPRSTKTLARLARTCTAFQDLALNILWRTQRTFLFFNEVSSTRRLGHKFSITRNLTAFDFERVYFYCHRIRLFEVYLVGDNFNGLAIHSRLIIGPHIMRIQLRVTGDSFSYANVTAMLTKAAPPHLSSFMLLGSARTLSWSEAESLELLSTLHSVRTLNVGRTFLTSRAISIIAAFPALEDLQVSVTEQEMEDYTPLVGNSFPAITRLAFSAKTINACHLMLTKIQSRTIRSLIFTRTARYYWNVRGLVLALRACNLAPMLQSLQVRNCPWIDSSPGDSFSEESFKMEARTFECLYSFEHLRDLQIEPSSVDLDDNDLLKFAQSLPQLRSLVFCEVYSPDNLPKCTFTGMQHVIQFCSGLETLTLCVDARQILIFATQPDGEYPAGLHLANLNLRSSPISNARDVASYLTMILPVLTDFLTAYTDGSLFYEEEDEADNYRSIWLEVEELLDPIVS